MAILAVEPSISITTAPPFSSVVLSVETVQSISRAVKNLGQILYQTKVIKGNFIGKPDSELEAVETVDQHHLDHLNSAGLGNKTKVT